MKSFSVFSMLLAVTMLVGQAARAQETQIATAYDDYDKETSIFKVVTDANDAITELMVVDPTGKVAPKHFSLTGLLAKAVLTSAPLSEAVRKFLGTTKERIDVIRIQADRGFDPKSGGRFTLEYLTSGISESYSTASFLLDREGAGWALYTDNNAGKQRFNHMIFAVKTMALIGAIGIKSISFTTK